MNDDLSMKPVFRHRHDDSFWWLFRYVSKKFRQIGINTKLSIQFPIIITFGWTFITFLLSAIPINKRTARYSLQSYDKIIRYARYIFIKWLSEQYNYNIYVVVIKQFQIIIIYHWWNGTQHRQYLVFRLLHNK